MVEKEAAISRLQTALLRLPKDDLIKLLKSTYQAMRIKHGIPFERCTPKAPATSSAKGKAAKTPAASRSKNKHIANRKKQVETTAASAAAATTDAQDDDRVEQPTFRQINSFVDDFSHLCLSSNSNDSDGIGLPDLSEGADDASMHRSETSPTQCVARPSDDVDQSGISDRDFAIQYLKEDTRRSTPVPPLDFSGIGPKAMAPYRLRDLAEPPKTNAQNACANVEDMPRMNSTPTRNLTPARRPEQQIIGYPPTYGYRYPVPQAMMPVRAGVPVSYTLTTRPGGWPPRYAVPQVMHGGPQAYREHPLRPMYPNEVAYQNVRPAVNPAAFQARGRSVQRL